MSIADRIDIGPFWSEFLRAGNMMNAQAAADAGVADPGRYGSIVPNGPRALRFDPDGVLPPDEVIAFDGTVTVQQDAGWIDASARARTVYRLDDTTLVRVADPVYVDLEAAPSGWNDLRDTFVKPLAVYAAIAVTAGAATGAFAGGASATGTVAAESASVAVAAPTTATVAAGTYGVPELGLVANEATFATVTAQGIPAAALTADANAAAILAESAAVPAGFTAGQALSAASSAVQTAASGAKTVAGVLAAVAGASRAVTGATTAGGASAPVASTSNIRTAIAPTGTASNAASATTTGTPSRVSSVPGGALAAAGLALLFLFGN